MRFGRGGLATGAGLLGSAGDEVESNGYNFVVVGQGNNGSGFLGARSENGASEIYFQPAGYGGGGPHLQFDGGIGRPAGEYVYTEIVHKLNGLHKHAQGVERFGAGSEHLFFGPIHSDVGGVLTYSHTFVTDIATGRTIFNPDIGSLPATYISSFEFRSMDAALPVVKLTPASGQTDPVLDLAGGGFIQGTERSSDPAAPAANAYRLFSRDNGAGKTQLCVRFATGAVQVLASEP